MNYSEELCKCPRVTGAEQVSIRLVNDRYLLSDDAILIGRSIFLGAYQPVSSHAHM